jgi:spore photoproduct lyase
LVNKSAENDKITDEIMKSHPSSTILYIPDNEDISKIVDEKISPKETLLLTHSKGQVVKGCPGTNENYLCCRYQIINQTQNCPLNCTYCILQFYINQPAITIYTNFEDIFSELREKLKSQPDRLIRIGTGELGDSLALIGSRLFAKEAISFFADVPNALFELKSKTADIGEFLSIRNNGHTVFSWSLNPQKILKKEEIGTASIDERLYAALQAENAGFLLGFHFDPILHYPDWRNLYSNLIDQLYSTINPSKIAWISLGSLRFPPSMKEKIMNYYPHSTIVYDEMIAGMDKKLRYSRPVRVPMYKFIYSKLTEIENPPFIYFCMESPLVWNEIMGFSPISNAHLDYIFAESLNKRFPDIINAPLKYEVYKNSADLYEIG